MAIWYGIVGLLFLVNGIGGFLTQVGFDRWFDLVWVAVGINFLGMAVVTWRKRRAPKP